MVINRTDLDYFFKKAVEEKCEITINYTPENVEIHIEPWKPFEYRCPYEDVKCTNN